MKRRIAACVLALAMCLSLGTTVLAAGGFSDVPENAWYLPYLDDAVASGLIAGRGDGVFAPADSITGAEGVKLAACIHQLFTDGAITLENGSPWYATYMDYALENGILDAALDSAAVGSPIARADLMDMVCRAIPQAQRVEKNDIPDGAIPDIFSGAAYRDSVYTLYRMGIVGGSDDRGSCLPDDPIKRSEVAALCVRTIDPDQRLTVELAAPATELDQLRARAADHGDLCAAATLGYMGLSETSTIADYLQSSGWAETFSFLTEIPQSRQISQAGDELYVIIPASADTAVRVYSYVMDESNGYMGGRGELLAEFTGDPFLLRCNVSDIFPNVVVVLETADGETLEYSPSISLKDGTLGVPDTGVYDFSQY